MLAEADIRHFRVVRSALHGNRNQEALYMKSAIFPKVGIIVRRLTRFRDYRMLRPAVNRQPGFRRGLVEQSNAEKNNRVGWLADWLLAWAVSAGLAWVAG